MSLGEAAQAVAAFVMVQTALNWLVDNYPGLAECLSSVIALARCSSRWMNSMATASAGGRLSGNH